MRGIHLDAVRQSEKLAVQRIVEQASELLRRVCSRKVGPSHVADKQRVSGERGQRRRRLLCVGENQTDALQGVSRRFEDVDAQFADAQLETIANSDMRKSCACFFSDVDSRTRSEEHTSEL